ncbi:hypothetical protein C8255_24585, partial [filamentous cyanobacterium CCP3]
PLLRAGAGVLHSHIRAIDLAARIGGDEFVLLMVGCTPEEARDKVETIRQELHNIDLSALVPRSGSSTRACLCFGQFWHWLF